MRVLVCGSRDLLHVPDTVPPGLRAELEDKPIHAIHTVLLGLWHSSPNGLVVIEGGAEGADKVAARWADLQHVEHLQYKADWSEHGRAAGPIRNKKMLTEGRPDQVWAFVRKPLSESKGTKNMVEQAEKAGIPTFVVNV